jgi:hypothetical protein
MRGRGRYAPGTEGLEAGCPGQQLRSQGDGAEGFPHLREGLQERLKPAVTTPGESQIWSRGPSVNHPLGGIANPILGE